MRQLAEPLPLTPLHRHELRNAIRMAVRRKEFDVAQRQEAFRAIDQDLKEAFIVHQPVTWTAAFQEAERIGESCTEATGIRAADLLHLGIASALGMAEFLTFDRVQRDAARKAGFRCRLGV